MKKELFSLFVLLLCAVTASAYDVQIDGVYYNLDKVNKTAEVTHGTISVFYYSGEVRIPETIVSQEQQYTVTAVGDSAFWYCRLLTAVEMPNTVKRIGDYAMQGCEILKTVEMSNSVDSIGEYAFAGAEKLQAITLPKTLQKIKPYAFFRCESLTSLNIPDAVTEIGTYAFSECTSVKDITVGNGLLTLGSSAFADNTKLQAIELPGSLKRIEYYTFEGCTSLKDVTLHEGLEFIGERAFSSAAIENITIPVSVSTLNFGVFRYNSALKSVTFPSATVPVMDEIFYGITNISNVNVYVPAESVSSYETDGNWGNYKPTIRAMSPTALNTVAATGKAHQQTVYQLNDHVTIISKDGKNIKVLK